jgi:membrane fusion protein, multidrug efflux system
MPTRTPPLLVLALALYCPPALSEDIPARLDWSNRLELGTPVSGVVVRVQAEPGQRVRRGELLVQLDERGFRAELEETQAQERRLRLAWEEARREYERAQELYERTVISQRDLSLAEIGLTMAEAEHAAAKARLTQARLNLEYSSLRAPFDGLVVMPHVRTGETVNNRLQVTPVVTLAATEPMLARGFVGEEALSHLAPDQALVVLVGDRLYDGTLSTIALEGQEGGDGPEFEILVRFGVPAEHGLRAGQSAIIRLP